MIEVNISKFYIYINDLIWKCAKDKKNYPVSMNKNNTIHYYYYWCYYLYFICTTVAFGDFMQLFWQNVALNLHDINFPV